MLREGYVLIYLISGELAHQGSLSLNLLWTGCGKVSVVFLPAVSTLRNMNL